MPKPNNKNTRNGSKQRHLSEPDSSLHKKAAKEQLVINSREDNEIESKKQCLIICEGETEAAYFEALQDIFNLSFNCTVLPTKTSKNTTKKDNHKGDIKNLLNTAIAKSIKVPVLYDAIWVVFDNDEQNSYKLDDDSFKRFENANIDSEIINGLKAKQIATMNVRKEDIAKNEDKRVRYFLNEADYLNFLDTKINVTQDELKRQIIEKTSKSNLLFEVFDDENFEIKWRKANINIAFSSISFEYWLLLHFEKNQTAFYNSREIIHYFDTQNYFDSSFQKGWYLYEKRDDVVIKNFFQKVQDAILNNIWLNTQMQSQINSGKKFYEINPFSDVFRLSNLLINNQLSHFCTLDTKTDFLNLRDFIIQRNNEEITINFTSAFRKTILVREITNQLCFYDINKNIVPFSILTEETKIIQVAEKFTIKLSLNINFQGLMLLKNLEKGKENVLFCWI